MFGFVGQTNKMDKTQIYDTYIKIVPPLKRVGEVLLKTLEFFGWKNVGIIGGGADANTWDKVDGLFKSVEQQLQGRVTVTSSIKFDVSDQELTHKNVKHISKLARGTIKIIKSTKYLSLIIVVVQPV